MLALVAPAFTNPSGYQLSELPIPTDPGPEDVIIRVHAASINPVDVKLVAGAFKLALRETLPIRIGYDCAGVIESIGSDVDKFKVGDKVWSRLPEASKGSWAEYVKVSTQYVSTTPDKLSFAEAASMPLAAMTAMQALQKYAGSLAGKTVFVPAGLSGTGAFACQLAKRLHKAGKVITTVSTSKVDKIPELLGESVVDQVIDYTEKDPMSIIPRGSVDFILDTVGQSMQFLSLLTPRTGTIVSISTAPSGSQLQQASFFKRPDRPTLPFFAKAYLDSADYVRKLRARRWNVNYTYMFLESSAMELDLLKKHIEKDLIRPVIGSVVSMHDLEKTKAACMQVYNGKGGIGKTVIKVIKDV